MPLLFISFSVFNAISAQLSFFEKPIDDAFYCRDVASNEAIVPISGVVDYPGVEKLALIVFKNGAAKHDHVAYAIGRTEPEPYGSEVAEYLFGLPVDPKKVWGMFGSCTLMARKSLFNISSSQPPSCQAPRC